MGRKHGFSFSWKRAVGISEARGRFARATGIPTTRGGMERKVGRSVIKGIGFVLVLVCAGIAGLVMWAGGLWAGGGGSNPPAAVAADVPSLRSSGESLADQVEAARAQLVAAEAKEKVEGGPALCSAETQHETIAARERLDGLAKRWGVGMAGKVAMKN